MNTLEMDRGADEDLLCVCVGGGCVLLMKGLGESRRRLEPCDLGMRRRPERGVAPATLTGSTRGNLDSPRRPSCSQTPWAPARWVLVHVQRKHAFIVLSQQNIFSFKGRKMEVAWSGRETLHILLA